MKTTALFTACIALCGSALPTSVYAQAHARSHAQANAPTSAQAAAAAEARTDAAADHATLDRTRILGQRELPKVLTIVPWKKPLALSAPTRPLRGVLDEALAPVDRSVLQRELRYHAQLRERAAGPGPVPTPGEP